MKIVFRKYRFCLAAELIELLHIASEHGQAEFSASVQNKQHENELPVCSQKHLISRIQTNGLPFDPTSKEVIIVAEISLDPVANLLNLFLIHNCVSSVLTSQRFQILNVIQQFAELLIIKQRRVFSCHCRFLTFRYPMRSMCCCHCRSSRSGLRNGAPQECQNRF